jgi:hypothetical protein
MEIKRQWIMKNLPDEKRHFLEIGRPLHNPNKPEV